MDAPSDGTERTSDNDILGLPDYSPDTPWQAQRWEFVSRAVNSNTPHTRKVIKQFLAFLFILAAVIAACILVTVVL